MARKDKFASVAVGSVLLVALALGPVAAASPSVVSSDGSQATAQSDVTLRKCSDPAPVLSDDFVSVADSNAAGSFTAEIKTFNVPGSHVFERLPPQGWLPQTATPEELSYFNIPARPDDAVGLAAWTTEWVSDYSGFGDATPCLDVINARAGVVNTDNWSGFVSEEGSINEVYGSTTFAAGSQCSAQPDSYTNWVGIGGYGVSGLIQNGLWSAHSTGSFPFYEVVYGSAGGIGVTQMDLLPAPSLGDRFNLSVEYTGGEAVFSWHDVTNGAEEQLYDGYEDGHAMSHYYNGAVGEAVDERGTVDGEYSSLRDFGSDSWTNVQAAQGSGALVLIRNTSPSDGMNIDDNSTRYSTYTTPTSNRGDFVDDWENCGVAG